MDMVYFFSKKKTYQQPAIEKWTCWSELFRNTSFPTIAEITRYDYNLKIMKSPKPATDTISPHIKF